VQCAQGTGLAMPGVSARAAGRGLGVNIPETGVGEQRASEMR
jgi:hypothetical protein